jgi:hypothetical protein
LENGAKQMAVEERSFDVEEIAGAANVEIFWHVSLEGHIFHGDLSPTLNFKPKAEA